MRHGVDAFGRDTLFLGRILSTAAAFAEGVAGEPAAVPVSRALLELLQAPQVHGHPDPFVRRAAILGAGACLAALPGAHVAGALLGKAQAQAGRLDEAEGALVRSLEWLQVR